MKRPCDELSEWVVGLAFGETHEDAEAHVAQCPSCRQRLEQLKETVQLAKVPRYTAPAALVDAAKVLFQPKERRSIWARLVGSSLAAAGARSATDVGTFQLLFEAEGVSARVMYERTGKGWQVTGQADAGPEWSLHVQNKKVPTDDAGRFMFEAKELARTQLLITSPSVDWIIPSAEEALNGGPPEAR